ncbi:MAG: TIGR03087 family PEP-CTERM/XrtA system glycosyltransferase [Sedimenticola sp.]
MKQPLLLLCHRIPYPPNKGDKIRSYHLLKHLSESYSIYLGCFIDDPSDWAYTDVLDELCEETCFVKLTPGKARAKSIKGLLNGEPLTLPYYFNNRLATWVEEVSRRKSITRFLAYSSAMAQYAMYDDNPFNVRIIDFVDIDSDKWRQYSTTKSWPMNWIYRREADRLLEFEKKVAKEFDKGFFVSLAESEMFKRLSPETDYKIHYYNNGVDTDFFNPGITLADPYPDSAKPIVFTGAMDYWPNVDAVVWFAESIMPKLLETEPQAKFYVVGGNPTDKVKSLAGKDYIEVTGRVEDIRPYMKHAIVSVAPMRIARGIQNKVLEAMAMARPVIASPQGYEGITATIDKELYVADEVEEWLDKVRQVLTGRSHETMGRDARERVVHDYSWQGSLSSLGQSLSEQD